MSTSCKILRLLTRSSELNCHFFSYLQGLKLVYSFWRIPNYTCNMTNMTTKVKPQDKSKMCEIDENVLKMFEIKKRLGKGAYGIVWKAMDKRNNETVAVKKIFDAFRDETDAQRTFREIIFLNAFSSHPNIVKLQNVFRASNNLDIYLIFEYMESDLHNIIKRGNVLKDIHKRYVMYQLINAIKYIHSGNVIHRDLKPSNILIDSKCRCKLADFGLARSLMNRESKKEVNPTLPLLTDYVATRWYRAPEILVASKKYTKGIDMWSLGCILGEMLRGKPLFQGTSTVNQIERIISALPEVTAQDVESVDAGFGSVLLNKQISRERKVSLEDMLGDVPSDAMDLVKSLLLLDPLARLTAHQALEHSYVSRFRHSIPETDLNVDIVPPFSDDKRLTVPEYRSKLYEITDNLPVIKPYRSANSYAKQRFFSNHKGVVVNEKSTQQKTRVQITQNLDREKEKSLVQSRVDVQCLSQEQVPSKTKISPQLKTVPIKTMISSLPSKTSIGKTENEGKIMRKIARKPRKMNTLDSTTLVNKVDKYLNSTKTATSNTSTTNNNSQESSPIEKNDNKMPTTGAGAEKATTSNTPARTFDQNNVRSLIKKRLAATEQNNYYQQHQILTPQQQKSLDLHEQYQQKQQQQQQQKHYEQTSTNNNRKTLMQNTSKYHNNSLNQNLNQQISMEYAKPTLHTNSREQMKVTETQISTANNMKNIRQRISSSLAKMEISKMRAQNTRINLTLNSETINNNNNNNNNNNYNKTMFEHAQQHPKSAESATMNNKVFPCITMDNIDNISNVDINCYEERLRRIEEEIKTYKNEVKSYAYDNLRTSKKKIELATTTTATKSKPTIKTNNHNNNNNNKYSTNNSISSERYSSDPDPIDEALKQQISNLPELNVKNAYLQFRSKRSNIKLPNNGHEIGTGGSGDHVTGEKMNRRLESSVKEYQQQQQLHDHDQRLQFKRSVSNLIKSHLQSTPTTATMTTNNNSTNSNNIMQLNEYRYKSCGRRKTTKAF